MATYIYRAVDSDKGLSHYGVKGMKWHQHLKRKTDDNDRDKTEMFNNIKRVLDTSVNPRTRKQMAAYAARKKKVDRFLKYVYNNNAWGEYYYKDGDRWRRKRSGNTTSNKNLRTNDEYRVSSSLVRVE